VNLRALAVNILIKTARHKKNYEHLVIQASRRHRLSQSDQNFLYILVKETIQYRKYLDYVIRMAVDRPLKQLDEMTLNLLRVGVLQSHILKTPVHAYVFETVAAAKRLGKQKVTALINAVLRHLPSEREIETDLQKYDLAQRLALHFSHPCWLVKKWIEDFGAQQTRKILAFNNQYQAIHFRHNPLRKDWSTVNEMLTSAKLHPELIASYPVHFFKVSDPGRLLKSELFNNGDLSVQDYNQALAVLLLNPQKGEVILDVCAAPGGKTTLLGLLQPEVAALIAVDISQTKIQILKNEVSRLDLNFINYCVADATEASFRPADKILIDAPCSGTGVLGRRADLRWNRSPTDITNRSELQLQILKHMANYIKTNGVLVYSTCSIEKQENWDVVDTFLTSSEDFELDPADLYIDSKYCDKRGAIHILPGQHDFTGSFAVRLKRSNRDKP